MRFGFRRRSRKEGRGEGQYVDVLLSLWPYLDEDSRDTLIRERPPSAPVLLAAYRRAARAADPSTTPDPEEADAERRTGTA